LNAFDRRDRRGFRDVRFEEKIFLRVLVETPAPPAFRKERIGKETAAGMVPPVSFLPQQLLALGS
jgi:hypothetical protein